MRMAGSMSSSVDYRVITIVGASGMERVRVTYTEEMIKINNNAKQRKREKRLR